MHDPTSGATFDLCGNDLLLGVQDNECAIPPVRRDELPRGAILFAGTDGIWEACDSRGDFFGKQRVRDVLAAKAGCSASQIAAALEQAIDTFCGQQKRRDDLTFVVLKFE